jgi:N-acetylglucosaminyldiphosphoundecaprenol N-acetyl-beta-D-mannosaminyltransferase
VILKRTMRNAETRPRKIEVAETAALGAVAGLPGSAEARLAGPPVTPAWALPSQRRIALMDCPLDCITEHEAVAACLAWCEQRQSSRLVVPINVHILMLLRSDARLRDVCAGSDLLLADGMPVVWAARLLGMPLRQRVSGVDLMTQLLERGARRGLRVFFLGAEEDVVTRLVALVGERFPGVGVTGYRNGFFAEQDEPEIVRQIAASGADLLFIGMPSPWKEVWAHQHRTELGVPVTLCVGGTFDVLAGKVKRAPRWMQRAGLEWFWRVLMEPRRLWKRYLTTNTLFLSVLGMQLLARLWPRRADARPKNQNGDRP